MQTKKLNARIFGQRATGEKTIFGLSWLEIFFSCLIACAAALVLTHDSLHSAMRKLAHPIPSPIRVMEAPGFVHVSSNSLQRPLESTQLESFEFFWMQENSGYRLVQIMRNERFVVYHAEKL